MEKTLLKNLLSRFSKYAFRSFVFEMLNYGYSRNIISRPDIGEGVYERYLTDGTIFNNPTGDTGFYITQHLPFELFKDLSVVDFKEPEILQTLNRLNEISLEKKKMFALYFLNNFASSFNQQYQRIFLEKYLSLTESAGITSYLDLSYGDINSFVDQRIDAVETTFLTFFKENREGICITISPDDVSVNTFCSEKPILSGVSQQSLSPYEPVFVYKQKRDENLLREFESLIKNNAKESDLEEFLVSHYKDIFGVRYDRIETQLWLKFPELDIAGKQRRLDLFLRNSVSSDWELFEVKRAINLTGTYRDIPVINKEVTYAIQQVRNYSRILSQDAVKRRFAEEGIEYYEPALHLVIGRKPQLQLRQWRYLIASNENEVKILTFDDLLMEMKLRQEDRYRIS